MPMTYEENNLMPANSLRNFETFQNDLGDSQTNKVNTNQFKSFADPEDEQNQDNFFQNKNSNLNDAPAIMRLKNVESNDIAMIRESAAESLQSDQVDVHGIVPDSMQSNYRPYSIISNAVYDLHDDQKDYNENDVQASFNDQGRSTMQSGQDYLDIRQGSGVSNPGSFVGQLYNG